MCVCVCVCVCMHKMRLFLACEDKRRRFDEAFHASAFFLFFVEISSHCVLTFLCFVLFYLWSVLTHKFLSFNPRRSPQQHS